MSATDGAPVDAAQFEDCWHANIRRVVAYAERHVGRDAAYDVASSTFLTAWRTWKVIPPEPMPWLISVARGHVRNHHRTLRRRASLEDRLSWLETSALGSNDAGVTASDRADALALLAALPEADREAVLLTAWEGLSVTEAAAVLGCRPGTFRMRLHRARARLDTLPSASTSPTPLHGSTL